MYIDIEEAIFHLSHSQPVAIPTETVWGLAARMEDEEGVNEIFRLKKRPPKNPLIIHIHDISLIKAYASVIPEDLEALSHNFWPGGLTLAIPIIQEKVPAQVRANLPTAAFRMPDHATTLSLLERVGPLVAPSANLSGKPSATTPQHIEDDFGNSFPILYSPHQPCSAGIESTILIWKNGLWHCGRPGAVSLLDIAKVLGYLPLSISADREAPLCPGQLYRHYAPKAHLTLHTTLWEKELSSCFDGVLGFTDRVYEGAPHLVTMGSSYDMQSIAMRLYAALRELDDLQLSSVFVDMNIPSTPEWAPIHDRLFKASST
jgi:L-threonylcarbamoyladenylate synthase